MQTAPLGPLGIAGRHRRAAWPASGSTASATQPDSTRRLAAGSRRTRCCAGHRRSCTQYFAGARDSVRPAAGPARRHAVPAGGVAGAAGDPAAAAPRSYGELAAHRPAPGRARRRRGRGPQPAQHRRALPPRARRRRLAHRLRRRPGAQDGAAAARRRGLTRVDRVRRPLPATHGWVSNSSCWRRDLGLVLPVHAPGRRRVRRRADGRPCAWRSPRVPAAAAAGWRGQGAALRRTGSRDPVVGLLNSAHSVRAASPSRCCPSPPGCRPSSTPPCRCSARWSRGSG